MYINKVFLYGNLTRDPEMRSLPSGMQVASFSIATNRVYKDKEGNKQESAEYHNIVVFGRQADVVGQYLKRGSGAFIEGRIQTRSWEQDGQKKYRTEVVADRVQFGPRSGGGAPQGSAPTQEAPATQAAPKEVDTIDYPNEDINPDDIPF